MSTKDELQRMINKQDKALNVMAQDFLRLCPEMKKVALDYGSLVDRYLGYIGNNKRPPLPKEAGNGDHL